MYSTIQCSTLVIILCDSKGHWTIPQYIMSCSVVHNIRTLWPAKYSRAWVRSSTKLTRSCTTTHNSYSYYMVSQRSSRTGDPNLTPHYIFYEHHFDWEDRRGEECLFTRRVLCICESWHLQSIASCCAVLCCAVKSDHRHRAIRRAPRR